MFNRGLEAHGVVDESLTTFQLSRGPLVVDICRPYLVTTKHLEQPLLVFRAVSDSNF